MIMRSKFLPIAKIDVARNTVGTSAAKVTQRLMELLSVFNASAGPATFTSCWMPDMSGNIISTSVCHWVKKIVASTNGDGVLRLTLEGDQSVSDHSFNQAEIIIFTDDVEYTDRLIEAINAVVPTDKLIGETENQVSW
jgi:uncharacterized protein YejL (UPF0352 family)